MNTHVHTQASATAPHTLPPGELELLVAGSYETLGPLFARKHAQSRTHTSVHKRTVLLGTRARSQSTCTQPTRVPPGARGSPALSRLVRHTLGVSHARSRCHFKLCRDKCGQPRTQTYGQSLTRRFFPVDPRSPAMPLPENFGSREPVRPSAPHTTHTQSAAPNPCFQAAGAPAFSLSPRRDLGTGI